MSDTLTLSDQEILEQIQREVADNRVFVFMKGTPEMPRCGFSLAVSGMKSPPAVLVSSSTLFTMMRS